MSEVSQAQVSRQSLRIMLVDDHQTVRQGLRALLRSVPNAHIVDEAADGQGVADTVRHLAPDLLIVDLSMPCVNGLTLMRQLRLLRADTKIIVLSRYREISYVRDAFAAGARAYVLKQSSFEELRCAIAAVLRGDRYVDAALEASEGEGAPTNGTSPLTVRETDVLKRSALGHTNREISESLEIAVKTVEAHKSHAMEKLGLGNRRQLITYAAFQGWFREA